MVPDALSGGPHFAAYCERYIRHTKGRWAGQPLVYELNDDLSVRDSYYLSERAA